MRAVYRSGSCTVLQAGHHLLSFYDSDKPYVDTPEGDVGWLANASQIVIDGGWTAR